MLSIFSTLNTPTINTLIARNRLSLRIPSNTPLAKISLTKISLAKMSLGKIVLIAALLDQPQTPQLGVMWLLAGVLLIVVTLAGVYLFSYMLRRMLAGKPSQSDDLFSPKPSTDNPTAFMAASMQAVIQKLRDQEKELAALHRRDRERAQQTERLSEAVTRNMPSGLLLVSSAGLITSANPAAEVALGVRALGYRRYAEILGAQTPLTKLLDVCLREGRTFRREEFEYTTPAGEVRHLGVTISPILKNGGHVATGQAAPSQVTGALCLLSDLSELAALQRQVLMKESLAALGELSAGIAHEFKNSLATISGYAQLIRGESQGDIAENSLRILEQTRALAHVVTEFLKFARPMDLMAEEIAVGSLVDRVIAEVCDMAADVKLNRDGQFENISGDEALLRQALLNLTRNAAEAANTPPANQAAPNQAAPNQTAEIGTPGPSPGQKSIGRVTLRGSLEQSGGQLTQRISVSDNGPGIPPADLSRIFVPFYTTKANGTGLGLAIVQKIVVQHGGTVEARNRPEGGAEFIVWLPLSRQASAKVDSLATSA
jgi:signal transduction histidine kinase